MIKLLALDLDGTLLDSRSRISDKNRETVQKCLQRGIKVAIVTGQPLRSAGRIISSLGLASPHAVSNGTLIVDHRLKKLDYLPIDAPSYRAIVDFSRKMEQQLLVSTMDGRLTYESDLYGLPGKDRMVKTDDLLAEHIAENVLLCTIMTRDGSNVKIKAEDISGEIKVRDSGLNYINIFNRRAGKTYGLKRILEYLKLSPDQVMAIGDGENDLGMIRMAKIGVAMGNASSMVKRHADYTTSDNDRHGLSEAIEQLL
ncbi:MAG: Cof-type HAD-IIB family hydrolase [Actinomycetota bacterium]